MYWTELSSHRLHAVAPDFRLQTAAGETITRAQYRQRQHLVLAFLPDPTAPEVQTLLDGLAAQHDEFAQASAALYIVSTQPAPLPAPLVLLIDPGGTVRDTYAAIFAPDEQPAPGEPFTIILDRYGTPAGAAVGVPDSDTVAADLLSWVWGIEYDCPE
ncbi:MAG: redoxin domain-containing protein [Chloroflexi bacterium]|nr:redoxin domain-containing protein [Chloroflexota bacterium]